MKNIVDIIKLDNQIYKQNITPFYVTIFLSMSSGFFFSPKHHFWAYVGIFGQLGSHTQKGKFVLLLLL